MMAIIHTKHLFEEDKNRESLACELVQPIFPHTAPEAIQYELVQQGLLQKGKLSLPFNAWQLIDQQFKELQLAWQGPTIPVYIFPIKTGFVKNGIAYKDGICLFISAQLLIKELHALFSHEYHHICRRLYVAEPPTLIDSLIMEGLAEDAVENLFGKDALSPWTERYSLDEVRDYWQSHFIHALDQKGLPYHQPFLFGDAQLGLPPWIGYCTGYRIIQAFKEKCGPFDLKELLQIKAEAILDGAGFNHIPH